jgi:hemerythrin-like domain-containing protein
MLNAIRTSPETAVTEETAADLLLGCHHRIRHFTDVALRLAQNPGAPAQDRVDACKAVLRYFTVALPLHEADENESVYPRLRSVLPEGVLAQANAAMVEQHRAINSALAQLIPLWRAIESDPEQQGALARLFPATRHLQQLWDEHLKLEEEQVIPAMHAHLPQDALDEIFDEMRGRRES